MPRLRRTPDEKCNDDFNAYVLLFQKKNKMRQEDIGNLLNLSHGAISQRLNGKTRWTLLEMALLVEEFGEPFTIGANK
jgi:transcriptional regulator with XRE-family HTH domain